MTRQTAAFGLRLVAAVLVLALSAAFPAAARDAGRGGAVVQAAAEGGHSYRRDRGGDARERGRHHRRDAGERGGHRGHERRGRDGASQASRGFEGGHSYRRHDRDHRYRRHERDYRRADRHERYGFDREDRHGRTHGRGERHGTRHDRGTPSVIRKINPWQ